MSRERVLECIRAALRDGALVDPPLLPPPQVYDNPVGLFVDRARQVGVTVEVMPSMEAAGMHAADWCERRGVRCAAVWQAPDLSPLLARLRDGGVQVLAPGAPLDALAQAGAGITGADWGIAETATLVLACAPVQPRMASLLPPAHLAIVRAERIVSDLPALFARLGPMPSALTFITGPSRSADVGLKPVLGAHGPTEVTVLLVR